MDTDHIPNTHSFSARSNVAVRDTGSTTHYCACLFVSLVHYKRYHVLVKLATALRPHTPVLRGSNAKVKLPVLHSVPRHEGTGRSGGAAARIRNLRTRYGWPASCHACFTPGEKAPRSHYIGDWVGLRIRLLALEKRNICCPCPELNYESSFVHPVAQLGYLRSSQRYRKKNEEAM